MARIARVIATAGSPRPAPTSRPLAPAGRRPRRRSRTRRPRLPPTSRGCTANGTCESMYTSAGSGTRRKRSSASDRQNAERQPSESPDRADCGSEREVDPLERRGSRAHRQEDAEVPLLLHDREGDVRHDVQGRHQDDERDRQEDHRLLEPKRERQRAVQLAPGLDAVSGAERPLDGSSRAIRRRSGSASRASYAPAPVGMSGQKARGRLGDLDLAGPVERAAEPHLAHRDERGHGHRPDRRKTRARRDQPDLVAGTAAEARRDRSRDPRLAGGGQTRRPRSDSAPVWESRRCRRGPTPRPGRRSPVRREERRASAASTARTRPGSERRAPRSGETRRCAVRSIICRRMRSWNPESSASDTTSAATPTARPETEIVATSATWARRRDAAR